MYDLRKAIQDMAQMSQMWQSFCREMFNGIGIQAQTLEMVAREMEMLPQAPISGMAEELKGY